jgi:hypothetical protein
VKPGDETIPVFVRHKILQMATEIADASHDLSIRDTIAGRAVKRWRELRHSGNSPELALAEVLNQFSDRKAIAKNLRLPLVSRFLFEESFRLQRLLLFAVVTIFSWPLAVENIAYAFYAFFSNGLVDLKFDSTHFPFEIFDMMIIGIALLAVRFRTNTYLSTLLFVLLLGSMVLGPLCNSTPIAVTRDLSSGEGDSVSKLLTSFVQESMKQIPGTWRVKSHTEYLVIPLWMNFLVILPKLAIGMGLIVDTAPVRLRLKVFRTSVLA